MDIGKIDEMINALSSKFGEYVNATELAEERSRQYELRKLARDLEYERMKQKIILSAKKDEALDLTEAILGFKVLISKLENKLNNL